MNFSKEMVARLEELGVSNRTIEKLDQLETERESYGYGGGEMHGKHFMPFVGATRAGKSTTIEPMIEIGREELGIDIAEVGSTVTRKRRPNDPADYITADEGMTHDGMVELIENRQLLNWSLNKTGHIYGGQPSNFAAKYNLQPFLPDSLNMMRKAGFATLKVVYAVTPAQIWRKRFPERASNADTKGRLHEALDSLQFGMSQPDIVRYVNLPGDEALQKASRTLIKILQAEEDWKLTRELESELPPGFYLHGRGMQRVARTLLREAE